MSLTGSPPAPLSNCCFTPSTLRSTNNAPFTVPAAAPVAAIKTKTEVATRPPSRLVTPLALISKMAKFKRRELQLKDCDFVNIFNYLLGNKIGSKVLDSNKAQQ